MSNTDKTLANPRQAIERAITEKQAKLDAVRRQAATLEGEIHAYQSVLGIIIHDPASAHLDRRTHFSHTWARILQFIHDMHPSGASVEAIMGYVEEHDLGISRPAVRSQLSLYAGKGIVERLDAGLYTVPIATIERLDDQKQEPGKG